MDAAEEVAAPTEVVEAEPAVQQDAPVGDDQEMVDYGGQEPAAENGGEQAPEAADNGATEAADNGALTMDATEAAQATTDAAPAMQDDAGKADSAKDADDVMAQPPHGTEVFMSRLPKEATEAQVRAFCEKAGEVYTIRLPKDPGSPSQNKGFAFCVYKTKEAAEQALLSLQQQHLDDFPGTKVNVVKSEVKNRLFIGNLPRDMSQDAITTALEAEVKGLTSMELMHDKETGASRGFGFTEFYNHAAAEQARRALTRPDFKLGGRELTVTWAEPKRMDQAAETVKALYVNGLPDKDVDEDALRQLFTPYGQVSQVMVLHQADDPSKLRGYAFVHFEQRAHLLRVLAEVDGGKVFELGGKQLSVQQAKPQVPRDADDGYGRRSFGAERGGFGGRGSMPGRGGYGGGGYSGGPRGAPAPPMGGRGRGPPAYGGRGGGRGGYTGAPPSYDYDYGYGYEDYDAGYEGGYEEYDDGYGGYGGGMMMPMMLPTGQMVYAMAGQAGAGGPARRGGGAMPPHPGAARGGAAAPVAAGRTGGRGYGRGAAAPTGYGAPRAGAAAAGAGGPTGYGSPRGGAAAAGAGTGGYVPRGYGQGAGGGRTGYGAPRYNPY